MHSSFVSTAAERALFLREWLSNPRAIGAVAPSGEALARLITQAVRPGAGPVLELGPGTGVFSTQMLAAGLPQQDLVMVEIHPVFAQRLRNRFPASRVYELDVGRTRALAPEWRSLQAQAVICGLPLLNMGVRTQMRVLQTAFQALQPGGSLFHFTYAWRCSIRPGVLQRLGLVAQRSGVAWRNLPPASVYRVSRQRDAAGW